MKNVDITLKTKRFTFESNSWTSSTKLKHKSQHTGRRSVKSFSEKLESSISKHRVLHAASWRKQPKLLSTITPVWWQCTLTKKQGQLSYNIKEIVEVSSDKKNWQQMFHTLTARSLSCSSLTAAQYTDLFISSLICQYPWTLAERNIQIFREESQRLVLFA